jgi:hypothetical protein
LANIFSALFLIEAKDRLMISMGSDKFVSGAHFFETDIALGRTHSTRRRDLLRNRGVLALYNGRLELSSLSLS